MVLYHQEQDKLKQQKEDDDKKKSDKERREAFLDKINAHFEKYQHFYRYGVIGGGLMANWYYNCGYFSLKLLIVKTKSTNPKTTYCVF